MKSENSGELIYKEVVVIGNGPSGIALSYMLSGNLPHLISSEHPDEMLASRLASAPDSCLINCDLEYLASGLEGRSINPVSLLMDCLLQPCADMGLEMEPLVKFRKSGKEIDHIVLGKGPPGGSWHKMDPNILTLSLGSWMSLPECPLNCRDSGEKRVFASTVANYYTLYVKEMNLSKYFKNYVVATTVNPVIRNQKVHVDADDKLIKINEQIESEHDNKSKTKKCLISNAFHYILGRNRKLHNRCGKRPRDLQNVHEQSPDRKIREISENESDHYKSRRTERSLSWTSEMSVLCDNYKLDQRVTFYPTMKNPQNTKYVPSVSQQESKEINWVVETRDTITDRKTTYFCRDLILANGCGDLPNQLAISSKEPGWLLYDLRSLELRLEDNSIMGKPNDTMDPVMVVGAGLSAADAIIAIRGKNIPVVHAFRNKSVDLNKQLPENMYPEYHKVHQMMQDGGSAYPLYKSYPGYSLISIDEKEHTVTLSSKLGENVDVKVSYLLVLIGSRPDLSFLPSYYDIAAKKNLPIDGKTNTLNIDKLTHKVQEYNNLYAVGTLAGDNFVRFIPGGALAVVAELYKTNGYKT